MTEVSSSAVEFRQAFQQWLSEKGISLSELASCMETEIEEVTHLFSGRFPFSLSFLSRLLAYFPDFDLTSMITINALERKEVAKEPGSWEEVREVLRKPSEIGKVIVFYKNGTYREFIEG